MEIKILYIMLTDRVIVCVYKVKRQEKNNNTEKKESEKGMSVR